MNDHLANKNKRYEVVTSSKCFKSNLVGLATIELNVTELCSRKCAFCPRFDSSIYKNHNWNMGLDTVINLVSDCKREGYSGDISIAGFGEPMLHPNLHSIIGILCGHYTMLITNGDFLTKESLKLLVDSGLKKIVVSCYDGPKARDKFENILSEVPIDYHIKELWGSFDKIVKENDFNSRTGLVPITTKGSGQCYLPFYKLFIDWNGDVVLCSNDWWRKETGLGNINTTSLKKLWMGYKMNTIRKNLKDGNRCGKACKDCRVNGILIGKDSFDLLT